jgi:hypothetical protein
MLLVLVCVACLAGGVAHAQATKPTPDRQAVRGQRPTGSSTQPLGKPEAPMQITLRSWEWQVYPLLGCFALVGLGLFAFWLWMLVDCLTRPFERDADKIAWILALIFLNWLGALVYFFAGRRMGQRRAASPRR